MKKYRSTILFAGIFLTGLFLMLYPLASNYWNTMHQTYAIVDYNAAFAEFEAADYSACLEEAVNYNKKLSQIENPLRNYDKVEGYRDCLDVRGNGMMGYLTIPGIGVELPIYHGTSEGVLDKAVGHLEGSSLPVGGVGTHCVLSGHRGLPSARLFTDLDQMTEGDQFSLKVLNHIYTYEVFRILVVEPEQTEALAAESGEDYCTLVTCTPYGINSHRLLVQGRRTDDLTGEELRMETPKELPWRTILQLSLVAGVLLFVFLLFLTSLLYRHKVRCCKPQSKSEKGRKCCGR